jgi:ribonucleotide monophosphatase NagD (HAD superfamily)
MSDVPWNLPVPTAAKAWVSGIGSLVLSVLVPLSVVLVGDNTLADITQAQWVVIAVGALVAGGVVGGATYTVPNKARAS